MGEKELDHEIDPERAREFRRRYAALCNEFGLVVDSYEECWIHAASEWEIENAAHMRVYGREDDDYRRTLIVPEGPDSPGKQS